MNKRLILAASVAALLAGYSTAAASSYTWLPTAGGPFSWNDITGANWTPSGAFPGMAGDVANVNANLTANETINLNAVLSVGVLNLGDTNNSNAYTIAAGTGGVLTLDNSGSDAQINEAAGAKADIISAPIVLNSPVDISNATTGGTAASLTLSGGISAGITGLMTISNLSTGSGGVLISGAITDGSGTVAVVQNASGSILNLSNAGNHFTGGVTLNAGTLRLSSSGALGGGSMLTINGGTLDAGATISINSGNAENWNGDFTFQGTNSLNLGTGPVTLGGSGTTRTVTINGNPLTVGGAIGGSGFGLIKGGAGTLALNGANTYSGGTTINAGLLAFGTGMATIPSIAPGSVTINAAGVLEATGPTATIESPGFNNITSWLASGVITASSSGSLAVTGSGATPIDFTNYPNLFLGSAGVFSYSGVLTPGANGYRLGGSGTLTVSSVLNAPVGLATFAASGTVILTSTNGYTGPTTVGSASVLRISNGGALGTAAAGMTDGTTVSNGGRLELDGGITVANETIMITGTGTNSDGALSNQTGSNVWAGPVILGPGTGQGGAPRIGVTNAATASSITVSGVISDAGSGANASDLGIRNASPTVGMVILSGANTYHGNTDVIVGILRLGADGTLPATTSVDLGNNAASGTATLDLNGHAQTVNTVVPISGNNVPIDVLNSAANSATLTLNPAIASTSSVVFGNTGQTGLGGNNFNLVKAGSAGLNLVAVDTYTGSTAVTGGALTFNAAGSATASSSFVVTGAGLAVDNSTNYLATSRLGNGGSAPLTLQNGMYTLTGNATTGNSTVESMGTLTFDLGKDSLILNGTANSSTTFMAANLVRNNNAFGLIRGTTLGQTAPGTNSTFVQLTTAPSAAAGNLIGGTGAFGAGSSQIAIVPFLVGDTTPGGLGSTFVGYDPVNGLRPLNTATEFLNNLTGATPADNVRLTANSTNALALGGTTVNSLIMDSTNATSIVTATLTGTLTLNSGALLFSTALHSETLTGGVLQFASSNTATTSEEGIITNANSFSATINSQISGNGGLTLNTTSTSMLVLGSTANNWSGQTTVNGLVVLAASEVIPNGSAVYVALGGTLDLTVANNQTETIGSLAGGGSVSLTGGGTTGATLTAGGDNTSTTFSGVISGANGRLTKQGTGGLILSGVETYTGATTVNAGALIVSGSLAGSASATTVATGATLGGSGIVNPAVAALGVISPGNFSGGIGTLTLASTSPTGALDLSGGGTYLWELGSLKDSSTGKAGLDFDQIALTGSGGNLVLGGSSTLTLGFDNGIADPNSADPFWEANHSWTIVSGGGGVTNALATNFSALTNGNYADGTFSTVADASGNVTLNFASAIPEPGAGLMLAFGGVALLGLQRFRRCRAG